MATERRESAAPTPDQVAQKQALLRTLHSTVEALSVCVERVHELINQVDALVGADEPVQARPRAQISYGGGPSPLAAAEGRPAPARPAPPRPQRAHRTSTAERHNPDEVHAPVERHPPTERHSPAQRHHPEERAREERARATERPSTPALMAATELAHRGYSREEIAERMRERWGKGAAEILREVME